MGNRDAACGGAIVVLTRRDHESASRDYMRNLTRPDHMAMVRAHTRSAGDQVQDLQARVAQCISPTLSYACRYWGNHLELSPATQDNRDMLLEFLSKQLLFWIEVLSLSRCLRIGAPMVQQAQTWLRVSAYT